MQNQDNKFLKIFAEARHDKNLDLNQFTGTLNTLIKLCKKDFSQNNMDLENNVFSLINPNKRYQCTLDPNRIVVDFDEPNDINIFKNLFLSVFKTTASELNLVEYNRLGLRSLYGITCRDNINAGNRIKKLFLCSDNNKINELTNNCSEFHCGFNILYKNYKVNFNFAPAVHQNMQMYNNIVNNSTRSVILVDIDFYIEEKLNFDRISTFLKDGIEYINEQIKIFEDML